MRAPTLDTVAMAGFEDCQVAEFVTFCVAPPDRLAMAVNWLVCPAVMEAAPLTVRAVAVGPEDGAVGLFDELQADVQKRAATARATKVRVELDPSKPRYQVAENVAGCGRGCATRCLNGPQHLLGSGFAPKFVQQANAPADRGASAPFGC